ncbi:phosphate acyltransferase PlsX [Brockia lithotrophica]|uniref:Phosphate acyltransferase n=1 Tax=Brockia lithotrophica TaxID=933949 RepID=A0A660KT30_9BACL|nr:phosphate acyltransferase PlsX [Brockia lithotrophica]RKQ83626.1 phosphate:acyl-[acyl carrier protein] acyltransferase [Brockia lithotrophica]
MSGRWRIAWDMTGGDYAPEAPLEALKQVCGSEDFAELEFFLLGDEAFLRDALARQGLASKAERCRIVHAPEVIANDEEPVRALRRKPDASIVRGLELLAAGEADAFLSAGSTGAVMAGGLLKVGRIRGVERPGLAPVFPTADGRGVLVLDIGANVDAKPHHLLDYALLGQTYVRFILDVDRPRVGLLNVGVEEGKGNALAKEAYRLLRATPAVHFVGNVEARDVLFGVADVVVTDGFSGNVFLKAVEGTAQFALDALKEAFTSTFRAKLGALLALPAVKQVLRRFDYKEYGASPLLGLRRPVFKAHGSSDARAFVAALRTIRRFLAADLQERLVESLAAGKGETEEDGTGGEV